VPLICRERVLGVMTFVGVGFADTAPEMRALLQSIGHQIGITVESLRNMAAVLQTKDLLQSVFDGIPDCMVLLDRDLTVRMVNRAFLARHGCHLGDVIGRPCREVGACGEDPLTGRLGQDAIATQRQVREEVRTPAGEIFDVTHYPIADEAGEVWGVLRYAREVTLQKQVEQRIQQTEKLAALGQLAAGVAHEINNPMGVILCYTELLRRALESDGQALKDVETIEKQALTCQRIVSDLLNFARSPQVEQRPGDLNATLGEVVEMLRQQFRKQGTDIALELDPDLPVLAFDAGQLKQVFLNLLMNAHQALEGRGGRIEVRTRHLRADGRAEVAVRDNGSGIPPEIADRIFDPFFSTKTTGEGTGLGLSVSYGIVREHGGEIHMTSEPGAWTNFRVHLPLRAEGEGGTP
jgi:PAS domain S-box-containing protein